MCSKWGGQQPASRSVNSFICSEFDIGKGTSIEEDSRVSRACSDAVAVVCQGFCEYSAEMNGHVRDLLLDFILDLDEFDKLYNVSW